MSDTISRDEADEIYEGGPGFVTVQHEDDHRWYRSNLVVFEREDGTLWGFYYDTPASELQEDTDPYDHATEVAVFPVEAMQTLTYFRADE